MWVKEVCCSGKGRARPKEHFMITQSQMWFFFCHSEENLAQTSFNTTWRVSTLGLRCWNLSAWQQPIQVQCRPSPQLSDADVWVEPSSRHAVMSRRHLRWQLFFIIFYNLQDLHVSRKFSTENGRIEGGPKMTPGREKINPFKILFLVNRCFFFYSWYFYMTSIYFFLIYCYTYF